jgi:hypothetical protein
MSRRHLVVGAMLMVAVAAKAKERDMVQELIAASERGEPFMRTDRELGGIKLGDEEWTRASGHVASHPDHGSYHLLLAMRRQAPARYRELPAATRAQVWCGALAHLRLFNDWGHLGDPIQAGSPMEALVETGDAALACLKPLLDDRRPAPFYGSEDASLSGGYRRADFAYRAAALILGEQPRFAESQAERDRAIARLKTRWPKP